MAKNNYYSPSDNEIDNLMRNNDWIIILFIFISSISLWFDVGYLAVSDNSWIFNTDNTPGLNILTFFVYVSIGGLFLIFQVLKFIVFAALTSFFCWCYLKLKRYFSKNNKHINIEIEDEEVLDELTLNG